MLARRGGNRPRQSGEYRKRVTRGMAPVGDLQEVQMSESKLMGKGIRRWIDHEGPASHAKMLRTVTRSHKMISSYG